MLNALAPVLPELWCGSADLAESNNTTMDGMATGSELQLVVSARDTLREQGIDARVVSVPCLDWFEQQDPDYLESVLLELVRARVSIEPGIEQPWWRWLGRPVPIEHYSASADHQTLYRSSNSPPTPWSQPRPHRSPPREKPRSRVRPVAVPADDRCRPAHQRWNDAAAGGRFRLGWNARRRRRALVRLALPRQRTLTG
ncbi:transketolase [Rhodococcus wratislaviensis IFP 2016]|nr:transketolase [Rhodococcus wratislaviensis IFP 2016]